MPARQARLRQEHGAEFAGADQTDSHGPAGSLAFEQFGVEVHARNGNTAQRRHKRNTLNVRTKGR